MRILHVIHWENASTEFTPAHNAEVVPISAAHWSADHMTPIFAFAVQGLQAQTVETAKGSISDVVITCLKAGVNRSTPLANRPSAPNLQICSHCRGR